MKTGRRLTVILGLVLLAGTFGLQEARADTIYYSGTAEDLVGQEIVAGDKVFDLFAFGSSFGVDFGAVDVEIGIQDSDGQHFVTFDTAEFLADGFNGDVQIDFRVVTTGSQLIKAIGQGMGFGSADGGWATLGEVVHQDGFLAGTLLGSSTLSVPSDTADPPGEDFDILTLVEPSRVIYVSKDLNLRAEEGGRVGDFAFVDISRVRQTFMQTPVPEPASISLVGLGLGMLGLAGWRRRRS